MCDLTYQEAINLFKQWGFQVEPGPRTGEVTLLLKNDDGCTYSVQEQAMLPKIAAVILAVRWRNGKMACQTAPGVCV
ncbi:MAG: hypothetical protein JXA33_00040 [Anaerolineae bacterium]|nr:hypothetical protein [Anaerolineae bacterium]